MSDLARSIDFYENEGCTETRDCADCEGSRSGWRPKIKRLDQGVRGLMRTKAAWYARLLPTFSDSLAVVRYRLSQAMSFHTSVSQVDMQQVPRVLLKRFTDALCYAARRLPRSMPDSQHGQGT